MSQTGYTPIQLYHSTTASNTPAAGDLAAGELAINIPDGKLYYKDGATVKLLASNSGSSGDVVGPASATDNALARFDGTTGKLIQNSSATLSDSGAPTFVGAVTVSGTAASAASVVLGEDADNGSNTLTIKAAASMAADITLVMPDTDGDASQVLTTDGSGNLSWSTAGGISTGKSIAMAMIFGF